MPLGNVSISKKLTHLCHQTNSSIQFAFSAVDHSARFTRFRRFSRLKRISRWTLLGGSLRVPYNFSSHLLVPDQTKHTKCLVTRQRNFSRERVNSKILTYFISTWLWVLILAFQMFSRVFSKCVWTWNLFIRNFRAAYLKWVTSNLSPQPKTCTSIACAILVDTCRRFQWKSGARRFSSEIHSHNFLSFVANRNLWLLWVLGLQKKTNWNFVSQFLIRFEVD